MTQLSSLIPTEAELVRIRAVAAGHAEPDLIIRGGWVQSPGTEEWLARDVIISGRHIATLTPWGHVPSALREIDATGSYVVPGFIDAHLHIEYTNLTPGELARLSVPRGTTTILTDPNGSANVWGAAGMDLMLSTTTPLHIFQQVSPTTPGSDQLERGGAIIPEEVVRARLWDDHTATLGESNPFDYSERSTGRFREALAARRRMTGHTAAQTAESLWGYLAAGISDDHNASTVEEVLERTRLGAMITVMASSLTDNTERLFADLDAISPALRTLCFCADDKHAADLSSQGHIDHHVRQAIRFGVDPQLAYRMATTIPSHYYRLDQVLGVLAPSRLADIQIISDLADVRPSLVLVEGAVVGEEGAATFANADILPEWAYDTVHLPATLAEDLLALPAPEGRVQVTVRAMEMYNGYFKREFQAVLPVVGGVVGTDTETDVLKIAVIDRHHGDGEVGLGFVRGFGLRRGAIAITMNCPNMNIAVVGTNDEDMLTAVRALEARGGGFVTVADGEVLAEVPLPVGGMMSDQPWEQTAAALTHGHAVTAELGCPIPSPYIILSFVGLYVVPDLGLTELGLIDAATQSFVDVLLPGPAGACGHVSGEL